MKRVVMIINEIIDEKIKIHNKVGVYNTDFLQLDRLNKELELALNAYHPDGSIAQV